MTDFENEETFLLVSGSTPTDAYLGARGPVTIRMGRGSWRLGTVRCTACEQPFRESLTIPRQIRRGEA